MVELKVGLHCDECIKKILKAVKKIEGNANIFHQIHGVIQLHKTNSRFLNLVKQI